MAAVELDFSNVKEFQGRTRIPEGDYAFKIVSIDTKTKSKAGNPMWTVDLDVIGPSQEGKRLKTYLALTEKALFKLRDLLESIGLKVGKQKIKIDPQKLVGKTVGANVRDGEPYGEKGLISSEIAYFIPVDEVGNDVAAATESLSDAVAATDDEVAEEADEADVSDQLAEFDLDAL